MPDTNPESPNDSVADDAPLRQVLRDSPFPPTPRLTHVVQTRLRRRARLRAGACGLAAALLLLGAVAVWRSASLPGSQQVAGGPEGLRHNPSVGLVEGEPPSLAPLLFAELPIAPMETLHQQQDAYLALLTQLERTPPLSQE